MTTAELMRWLSLFHLRGIQLVDDQPRARRLTRRVWAVPVLQHDALEAESAQRLAPGAQAAGDERGDPDVRAGRHETLEVALPFEERNADERLTVDLEEVERAEDLAARELAGECVPLGVHLEVAIVLPVRDEDAVEDRRRAPGLRLDRVEELARPVHRSVVTEEARAVVADPDRDAGALPGRLEVVVRQRRLARPMAIRLAEPQADPAEEGDGAPPGRSRLPFSRARRG